MNPFNWLRTKVREACLAGMQDFAAEVNPDNPPQTIDDMRALFTPPPPALPAAEPAKPKRSKE